MIIKDFKDFLREYKIFSLAVAFVMGAASTALINSLVKDIIMPILSPLLSSGAWREATLHIGPVSMAYGSFLAELINFLILALVVFLATKKLFKAEQSSS